MHNAPRYGYCCPSDISGGWNYFLHVSMFLRDHCYEMRLRHVYDSLFKKHETDSPNKRITKQDIYRKRVMPAQRNNRMIIPNFMSKSNKHKNKSYIRAGKKLLLWERTALYCSVGKYVACLYDISYVMSKRDSFNYRLLR